MDFIIAAAVGLVILGVLISRRKPPPVIITGGETAPAPSGPSPLAQQIDARLASLETEFMGRNLPMQADGVHIARAHLASLLFQLGV